MGGGNFASVENNVSLRKRTWIHRGGNVSYWITPKSTSELEKVAELLYTHNISFITIGHTSNIWFKNDFDTDCILDTRQLNGFTETDNNLIVCDCGLPMKQLSKYCIDHGYAGYEGMINLPGTVAGAIVNNSSCYKCGVESTLKSIDIVTEDGKLKHLPASDLGYSFRTSKLKDGSLRGVIVRAYFDTNKHESPSVLQSKAEACRQDRITTQDPPAHNLGSAINTYGDYKGLVGIILKIFRKLLILIGSEKETKTKVLNVIACVFCGCPKAAKYISSKRPQCYIWKDSGADLAFSDYIKVMNKIYPKCSIEIEIKSKTI